MKVTKLLKNTLIIPVSVSLLLTTAVFADVKVRLKPKNDFVVETRGAGTQLMKIGVDEEGNMELSTGEGPHPTKKNHVATKKYVDDKFVTTSAPVVLKNKNIVNSYSKEHTLRVIKTGGIACLNGLMKNVTEGNLLVDPNNVVIGTIPEDYRPVQSVYLNSTVRTTGPGIPVVMVIRTNGSIVAYSDQNPIKAWPPKHYLAGGNACWVAQ